jgi:hypothetical protein
MNEGAIFGFTKNPVVNTISIQSLTSNTGGLKLQVADAVGTATAAKTFSIAVNVPAGSILLGCQLRVETALTSSDGGSAWSAAYATGATQAVATAAAFDLNTKVNTPFESSGTTPITSNTTTITVTADSNKTFAAGGKVRAIVYYMAFTAMDSL